MTDLYAQECKTFPNIDILRDALSQQLDALALPEAGQEERSLDKIFTGTLEKQNIMNAFGVITTALWWDGAPQPMGLNELRQINAVIGGQYITDEYAALSELLDRVAFNGAKNERGQALSLSHSYPIRTAKAADEYHGHVGCPDYLRWKL